MSYIAEHLAKMIGVAGGAGLTAQTLAPPSVAWADKWKHGYVGCALAKAGARPDEIFLIAYAKEFIDSIPWIPGTPSHQDFLATLHGYYHHYQVILRRWWIFTWWGPMTCKEVCDHFKFVWEDLHKKEKGI